MRTNASIRAALFVVFAASPLHANAQSRDFKATTACLDSHNIETKSTRIPASNGAVKIFNWESAKATLMISLTPSDIVKGAVMVVQPGGELTSAVTVFSILGGCLLGVDRKLVTLTFLKPGVSSLGGAYFTHTEGRVTQMAMAWTKEDVRRLAK